MLPGHGLPCAWCREHRTPLAELRVVCAFEGAARDAIHSLKYDGMFGVAEPLATLMAAHFPEWKRAPDLVIPIPLHPERVRERGYNQATWLARHLCRQLALEMDEVALWRTRPTRPQVGLDRLQRVQNVSGAFAADPARVRGRHVLLVDDVCTSGATLAAAASALLQEGAKSVRGYCFARPVVAPPQNATQP
jgi:ComF family protein